MRKLFMSLSLFTLWSSLLMADTAIVNKNKGEIIIRTDTYTQRQLKNGGFKDLVYYVNAPPTVVVPQPGASTAAITNDYIFFSNVTGQDITGRLPLTFEAQLQQAYANLQAILQYFKIPVTNVTKLELVLPGNSIAQQFENTLLANQVQETIWKNQPPRTLIFLPETFVTLTFAVRNPYKLKVRSVLSE